MRTTRLTAGPLAAASATNIATSQTIPGAYSVTLNGTLDTGFVSNNIALVQTRGSAGNLTLNGARVVSGIAYLAQPQNISITSSGNDTGITFTVTGLSANNYSAMTETVTGSNASVVSTKNLFMQVFKIAASGAAAANVSAGANGYVATLDTPRRVLFTSGGNDSGITATLTGTDWNNQPISEVLTLANASTAYSVLDYATVTNILLSGATATTLTVGTNGVCSSRPTFLDAYVNAPTTVQVDVTGTVNYSVQQTLDDPNNPAIGWANVQWLSSLDTNVVTATASKISYYANAPVLTRVLLNSSTGTGAVVMTVTQSSSPF